MLIYVCHLLFGSRLLIVFIQKKKKKKKKTSSSIYYVEEGEWNHYQFDQKKFCFIL